MVALEPLNQFDCPQCGGQLHPDEGQVFLICPYCESTVYLDRSQVVFHWYLEPTLDATRARGSLARWMAGNETVKDLDKKASLTSESFAFFPWWYFKTKTKDGVEQVHLEPAAAISVSELHHLQIPAGDLRNYTHDLDSEVQKPTVPLDVARAWLRDRGVALDEVAEGALVHLPIYFFKYTYQSKIYTAVVEAGTGKVFANLYPMKAEAPYRLVGTLTALVFLCLASFPLVGALAADESGLGVGLMACSVAGIVAAPLLFALAAWVAAKI